MEIWKKMKEFGDYEVSNLGRVKSPDFILKVPTGQSWIRKGKILKPYKNKKGYLICDIRVDGKRKIVPLHRLVALAFIPNVDNKPQVNHIDGNKQNNCVENLEWCTNSENQIHAFKHGLQKGNFSHPNSKLTLEQVRYIKNNCIVGSKKNGMQTMAKKFKVSTSAIKQIMLGNSYKNIH